MISHMVPLCYYLTFASYGSNGGVEHLRQSYILNKEFDLHLPTICRYSALAASRSSSVGASQLAVNSMRSFIFSIFSISSLRILCVESFSLVHVRDDDDRAAGLSRDFDQRLEARPHLIGEVHRDIRAKV